MEHILHFIQLNANHFIVISGVVLVILLLVNGVKLSNHKSRIEEALGRNNRNYKLNAETKEMEEEADEAAAITPDTIRMYEKQFNNICSIHNVLIQFIPIFPLLGILGTVVGLMLEVQAGDMESMMASLNVALTSTFWGLISAISLKIIEAVFPSKIINDVEVMLDDFDKKMNLAEMFQKFRDEK